MRHLDTNDWLMMNGMIYKIYTMEDEKKMRQDFLEQLKLLIDFDAADFYLSSDTQDTGLTDPVSCNCDCVSGSMTDWTTAGGCSTAAEAWCTGRRISSTMRTGRKALIIRRCTNPTTGIIPCR